ncbi:MAG: hypothetical protein CVT77_09315 [Alphaproteobacteria bacterium HGW-Alphaproteobacteria-16]|nr:MAG: hypothetical protein CVT77_09315 [Alphaproteobacteria bacterium HGW-Alphaproteobacteria-16]
MIRLGREPHREGGVANAEYGLVLLDGPGGVAIALTPDAADATARSLHAAAEEARRNPQTMPPIPA